jgi:hypothetical protein
VKVRERISVDFNTMNQDIWRDEPRVRINGHWERPDLQNGQIIVVYDEVFEVEAVLEYDPEHDTWWARPDWSTRHDLPQSRPHDPLPP